MNSNQSKLVGWVRRSYTPFAVAIANTFLLFLLVNLVLAAFFFARDAADRTSPGPKIVSSVYFKPDGSPLNNGKRHPYQLEWFDYGAYDNAKPEYASAVLDDFFILANRGFIYQPWVEFSEPPFKGKLVNIDVDQQGHPVRRTVNPSNDAQLRTIRIFTFGGSTTFGYNVSDEHTWPTYLSKILNDRADAEHLGIHIEVTNYGHGYYNYSQETTLLINLLRNKNAPDQVIFMDGLNWPYPQDVARFTDTVMEKFRNLQFRPEISRWDTLNWVPIVRLANVIRRRLVPSTKVNPETGATEQQFLNDVVVDRVVDRFDQNTRIAAQVCEIYSVTPLFFTQPNASYNYSLDLYRMQVPQEFLDRRKDTIPFYDRLQHRKDAIYLGDLFKSFGHRKAILDEVHYNPAFGEYLALRVAEYVDLKELSRRAHGS
jgi:hypothetical protein